MPNSSSRQSTSLWRPLRPPTFRNLLTANVVSDKSTLDVLSEQFTKLALAAWQRCGSRSDLPSATINE